MEPVVASFSVPLAGRHTSRIYLVRNVWDYRPSVNYYLCTTRPAGQGSSADFSKVFGSTWP